VNTSQPKTPQKRCSNLFNPSFVLISMLAFGCTSYPETSPKAYAICKALYAACNLEDEQRLNKIEDIVSDSLASSDITDQEAEWFGEIIAQARSGNWQWAQRETRAIMKDQIR